VDDSSGGLTSEDNKGSEQENLTPPGEDDSLTDEEITEADFYKLYKISPNTKNGSGENPNTHKDKPAAMTAADTCWHEIKSIFPPSLYGHDWEQGRELFDGLVADGIDLQWLMTQAYRYVESVKGKNPQYVSPIQRWFSEGRYKKDLPKTFTETYSELLANQFASSAQDREEQKREDADAQPTPDELQAIYDRAEASWQKEQG
jgi:hypothetical protein